jgi:hypothetical protein
MAQVAEQQRILPDQRVRNQRVRNERSVAC